MRRKGLSVVVATSIILAAIVTVSVIFQAFIVPEMVRERAFVHTQDVFRSLEKLYSEGSSVIPLSYSGIPFFSPTSFIGQLMYDPSISIVISAFNITEFKEAGTHLNYSTTIGVKYLSEAYLCCQSISEDLDVTCEFSKDVEKITFHLTSYQFDNWIRIQLNVTYGSFSRSYKYTVAPGDSLSLNLMDPLYYNLSFNIKDASNVSYNTNSPHCFLSLRYMKTELKDINYSSKGAIVYEPSNFPLSYTMTPWGLIALEAGNSSLPSSPRIFWINNTLILSLYNITWSTGTVGGAGSMRVDFLINDSISINSKFSRLDLNFTYNSLNLKNACLQLANLLKSSAPENIEVYVQEGNNWVRLSLVGEGNLELFIYNVKMALS